MAYNDDYSPSYLEQLGFKDYRYIIIYSLLTPVFLMGEEKGRWIQRKQA